MSRNSWTSCERTPTAPPCGCIYSTCLLRSASRARSAFCCEVKMRAAFWQTWESAFVMEIKGPRSFLSTTVMGKKAWACPTGQWMWLSLLFANKEVVARKVRLILLRWSVVRAHAKSMFRPFIFKNNTQPNKRSEAQLHEPLGCCFLSCVWAGWRTCTATAWP